MEKQTVLDIDIYFYHILRINYFWISHYNFKIREQSLSIYSEDDLCSSGYSMTKAHKLTRSKSKSFSRLRKKRKTMTHKLICFKCEKEFEWDGCPSNCVPIEPGLVTGIAWSVSCTNCNHINLVRLICRGEPKCDPQSIGWGQPALILRKGHGRADTGWVKPPMRASQYLFKSIKMRTKNDRHINRAKSD
jgi:hypothetical protein